MGKTPAPTRKTRIIATLGRPRGGTTHRDILASFIEAGVDGVRVNMAFAGGAESYGFHEGEYLRWLRVHQGNSPRTVAVLGDLPGPYVRLSDLQPIGDGTLQSGDEIWLNFGSTEVPARVPHAAKVLVNGEPFDSQVDDVGGHADIGSYVRAAGDVSFGVDDGVVVLKALAEEGGVVRCRVVVGGRVAKRNLLFPHTGRLNVAPFGAPAKRALEFLLDHGADLLSYVAIPYAQSERDILAADRCISAWFECKQVNDGIRPPLVVARIETAAGWENIDGILAAAAGIVVARGDLAVHRPPEEVPRIQKDLTRRCLARGKLIMVATQVLESMTTSTRPTFLETAEVFNAVLEGCDAIVLSSETSVGQYPLKAIESLDRVIREAELFGRKTEVVVPAPQALYSVFVSYGGPDERFAARLCEALEQAGVATFFFPRHAEPGKKLHRQMREGVNTFDRVILVCSRSSLGRPGVLNEIEETLQREARQSGDSLLIPITLDDYVFRDWAPTRPDIAIAIRDRVVADFQGTDREEQKFARAVERLVAALRRSD